MTKFIIQVIDEAFIHEDETVYVKEYEYMEKDGYIIAYPFEFTEDIEEAKHIPFHEAREVAKTCQGLLHKPDNVEYEREEGFIEKLINKVKGLFK